MFQLRRVTVLSALEKDSYMTDMISLLSNFQFGEWRVETLPWQS